MLVLMTRSGQRFHAGERVRVVHRLANASVLTLTGRLTDGCVPVDLAHGPSICNAVMLRDDDGSTFCIGPDDTVTLA